MGIQFKVGINAIIAKKSIGSLVHATIFLTRSKMILETALNFKHAFLFTLGIFDFIVTSQTRKPISNDDKRFANVTGHITTGCPTFCLRSKFSKAAIFIDRKGR